MDNILQKAKILYNKAYKILEDETKETLKNKINEVIKLLNDAEDIVEEFSPDIYVLLMFSHLINDDLYQACMVIAQYNIPCDLPCYLYGIPKSVIDYFGKYEKGINIYIEEKMISSNHYNDLYQIFEQYLNSFEYAKIIIPYARYEGRINDVIILSRCIKRYLKHENKKWFNCSTIGLINKDYATGDLLYLTDQISDLLYANDKYDLKNSINDAMKYYKLNEKILNSSCMEILPLFWTNIIKALNKLALYEKVIEIETMIKIPIDNYDFYLVIAYTNFYLKRYDDAERNCRRSIALNPTQENSLLLAKILFIEKKFEIAIPILINCINLISDKEETIYIQNYGYSKKVKKYERKIHTLDYFQSMESPYLLLFMCYLYLKEFGKAKVAYDILQEKMSLSDLVLISGYVFELDNKFEKTITEIEKEKNNLNLLFEEEKNKNKRYQNIIHEWTTLLTKCQIISDNIDLSNDDEFWENEIEINMNKIIKKITEEFQKGDEIIFKKNLEHVKHIYPSMNEQASHFLASAEQLYEIFKDNIVIDFAPVMVEYCKVFEITVWEYLERNYDLYKEEIKSSYKKTLGSAAKISERTIYSLKNYRQELEEMRIKRNKSAHKNANQKSDIIWIRKIVWESDFLTILINN